MLQIKCALSSPSGISISSPSLSSPPFISLADLAGLKGGGVADDVRPSLARARSSIHFCRIEKRRPPLPLPPLHLFTCPGRTLEKRHLCDIRRLGWAAVSRCSLLFFYGGRGNCLPHHRPMMDVACLLACFACLLEISAEKVRRSGTGGRNAFG